MGPASQGFRQGAGAVAMTASTTRKRIGVARTARRRLKASRRPVRLLDRELEC